MSANHQKSPSLFYKIAPIISHTYHTKHHTSFHKRHSASVDASSTHRLSNKYLLLFSYIICIHRFIKRIKPTNVWAMSVVLCSVFFSGNAFSQHSLHSLHKSHKKHKQDKKIVLSTKLSNVQKYEKINQDSSDVYLLDHSQANHKNHEFLKPSRLSSLNFQKTPSQTHASFPMLASAGALMLRGGNLSIPFARIFTQKSLLVLSATAISYAYLRIKNLKINNNVFSMSLYESLTTSIDLDYTDIEDNHQWKGPQKIMWPPLYANDEENEEYRDVTLKNLELEYEESPNEDVGVFRVSALTDIHLLPRTSVEDQSISSDKLRFLKHDNSLISSKLTKNVLNYITKISGINPIKRRINTSTLYSRVMDFVNIELKGDVFSDTLLHTPPQIYTDIFIWLILNNDRSALSTIADKHQQNIDFVQKVEKQLLSSLRLYILGKANIYNTSSTKSLAEAYRLFLKTSFMNDFYTLRHRRILGFVENIDDNVTQKLAYFWDTYIQDDPYFSYVYLSLMMPLSENILARSFQVSPLQVFQDRMMVSKELNQLLQEDTSKDYSQGGIHQNDDWGMDKETKRLREDFRILNQRYFDTFASDLTPQEGVDLVRSFQESYLAGDSYLEDLYRFGLLKKPARISYLEKTYGLSSEEIIEDIEGLEGSLYECLALFTEQLVKKPSHHSLLHLQQAQ